MPAGVSGLSDGTTGLRDYRTGEGYRAGRGGIGVTKTVCRGPGDRDDGPPPVTGCVDIRAAPGIWASELVGLRVGLPRTIVPLKNAVVLVTNHFGRFAVPRWLEAVV
jgi:hypothetical protein